MLAEEMVRALTKGAKGAVTQSRWLSGTETVAGVGVGDVPPTHAASTRSQEVPFSSAGQTTTGGKFYKTPLRVFQMTENDLERLLKSVMQFGIEQSSKESKWVSRGLGGIITVGIAASGWLSWQIYNLKSDLQREMDQRFGAQEKTVATQFTAQKETTAAQFAGVTAQIADLKAQIADLKPGQAKIEQGLKELSEDIRQQPGYKAR